MITKKNTKEKSLLFVARNYPPNIGGMEILNYELAKTLKDKVKLRVFANLKHRYSISFIIKGFFTSLISKEKVILLSDPLLSFYIPFLKLIGKKVIIRINGLDIIGHNIIYQLLIPFLTNFADVIICISSYTKQECIKRHINKKKIIVITPGIKPEKYYLPHMDKKTLFKIIPEAENKVILLSMGRLIRRKGHYWFIKEVIPMLDDNIIYILAGAGPEMENIKKLVEEKSLQGKVFLLGEISENTKKILLNNSDIFILPNIPIEGDMEGFGIVALEASSCGLPVIATGIEGITDAVIKNKNGLLVDSYDTKGYINLIKSLLYNKKELNDFRIRARKFASRQFSWDKIVKRYLKACFNHDIQ